MLDSTNILQHFEPQSGAILGRILGAKIAPKPLQLPPKNSTNINTAMEHPKQELVRIFQNRGRGGGPSRTTNQSPQEGRKSNALRGLRHGDGLGLSHFRVDASLRDSPKGEPPPDARVEDSPFGVLVRFV